MIPGGGPPANLVLATLERLMASEEFAGSAQLSRFLRHLVQGCLDGASRQLKESVIGVAVFNRGAGFDPKVDPIVRVEARRIRARLESYYRKHGAEESVRISLPKGGYLPTFELIRPVDPPGLVGRLVAAARAASRHWKSGLAVLLAAGLAAVALIAVRRATAPARLVSNFWSAMLDGDRPVLVVPADSNLVMLQNLAHESVQLQDYLTGEYRARLAVRSHLNADLVLNLTARRYTSIADLEFVNRLSHRREAARLGVLTRYARDVRVEDLKASNLVFLGARQSNPWIELFESQTTLRLKHDETTGAVMVLNSRPGPGETAGIVISRADQEREVYGVVSYHRNREGTGKVLIVAGTSAAGTEAAADFLLDDARFLPWLTRAMARGEVRGFDVLLHDRNLSGSARRADVVSFHVGS